jgi:hypothetical protein
MIYHVMQNPLALIIFKCLEAVMSEFLNNQ